MVRATTRFEVNHLDAAVLSMALEPEGVPMFDPSQYFLTTIAFHQSEVEALTHVFAKKFPLFCCHRFCQFECPEFGLDGGSGFRSGHP